MLRALIVASFLSLPVFAQGPAKPAVGAGSAHAASHAKQLTNAEFDSYLSHPESVLIVDVRRPDEVSSIGGFPVYLSVQAKELKSHLAEIPKDRPVITVSNHAARASAAADTLEAAGFKVLGAVGADTYQTSGGKLAVKIPVPESSKTVAAHAANTATN